MKKFYLLISLFILSIINAQTKFEPGFYITSSGEKIECLIKNEDWKNSPNSITIKKSESGKSTLINSSLLTEFTIINKKRYKFFIIDIEMSSTHLNQLTSLKEPKFKNEKLLLEILVEGKASLFKYEKNGVLKFFFSNEKIKTPKQLLYYKYIISAEEAIEEQTKGNKISSMNIRTNFQYKKDLFENVNCKKSLQEIRKLYYNESSLIKYFIEYNECSKSDITFTKTSKKSKFAIKGILTTNFNNTELVFLNNPYYSSNFGTKVGVGFGVELELILPFNNNKWALFLQPSYNLYSDEKVVKQDFASPTFEQKISFNYNYIQLPIGARHYFYLNENSKIGVDIGLNLKFSKKDEQFEYSETSVNNHTIYNSLRNTTFGLNYNYKKIAVEARYFTKTQILSSTHSSKYANYNNFSIGLKYQVL